VIGDKVRISITDEGQGIATDELEKIFTRFYRVPGAGNTAQGLGLGLYISSEIIQGHRGQIWAESEMGKGSTFHIQFPLESSGSQ
jgi:signal transduction histidine kinase